MTDADSPILTTTDIATVPETRVPVHDPPPPYPSPRARRSRQHARHSRVVHAQVASTDSQRSEQDTLLPPSPLRSLQQFPTSDDGEDATETTPFLSPTSPTSRRGMNRQRSFSHTSTVLSTTSAAPSLAHTLLSLFHPEDEDDDSGSEEAEEQEDDRRGRMLLMAEESSRSSTQDRPSSSFFSKKGVIRYFRPIARAAYYKSLLHLAVLNFPYALLAWLYLFVFTLTGTTLLMALPLGAALCFLNLLGARAFARGELALQTRFHSPLAFPPPYPPRPIFTRYREPTLEEIEAGDGHVGMRVQEPSFYKNAYSMFTDSTSYQALFYFLVIKPVITIVLTLVFLILAPIAFALILPAPFVLRAARALGVWQANLAVEGLYMPVR